MPLFNLFISYKAKIDQDVSILICTMINHFLNFFFFSFSEPTQNTTYTPGFIKVEPTSDLPMGQIQIMDHDQLNCTHLDQVNNPVFSPLSMGSSSLASPGSPNSTSPGLLPNGGGKMKSAPPSRKKSTASSNGVEDEEDISNIASLQTRIQIISQRVSSTRILIPYGTLENVFKMNFLVHTTI